MPIAFMELADKWNAFKLTNPVSLNIGRLKTCKDQHKPIIVLKFEYNGELVHVTCQADANNDFTAFHITEEGEGDVFESGGKLAGKKYVPKGGKKKYYNFRMTGAGATRGVQFTAADKTYDHDKGKDVPVVSQSIRAFAERDIQALLRMFLVFADP